MRQVAVELYCDSRVQIGGWSVVGRRRDANNEPDMIGVRPLPAKKMGISETSLCDRRTNLKTVVGPVFTKAAPVLGARLLVDGKVQRAPLMPSRVALAIGRGSGVARAACASAVVLTGSPFLCPRCRWASCRSSGMTGVRG